MLGNTPGSALFYVAHCLCMMHGFEKVALLEGL